MGAQKRAGYFWFSFHCVLNRSNNLNCLNECSAVPGFKTFNSFKTLRRVGSLTEMSSFHERQGNTAGAEKFVMKLT